MLELLLHFLDHVVHFSGVLVPHLLLCLQFSVHLVQLLLNGLSDLGSFLLPPPLLALYAVLQVSQLLLDPVRNVINGIAFFGSYVLHGVADI